MYVGSLFSGIGGIELGFEKAGFETRWFIEKDEYAKKILKKRFPNTIIYEDVTEIDFRTVPEIDILTGGFPCQDISIAGSGAGIKGSRSSLWKYYKEAIRVLQPKYAFIENVSMLTHRGLNVVLGDIAEIGYDAEWYNISASAVGAFHKRERLFVLVYPKLCRRFYRQTKKFTTEDRKQTFGNIITDGTDVSNSDCSRPINKEFIDNRFDKNKSEKTKKWKRKQGIRTEYENPTIGRGWWSSEPRLGRVANGIPNRVDRIKCLGNAVVPQVAEVFANAILELEKYQA